MQLITVPDVIEKLDAAFARRDSGSSRVLTEQESHG
jgi:hypothetical protein